MKFGLAARLSSPLIANALKLSSSNVILYGLPFVVTPLLSRIYSPDFFGEWGVFGSTFSIISVVMFGSYNYAIIKSEKVDAAPLCLLTVFFGVAVVLLTAAVFMSGAYLGIGYFKNFPSVALLCTILSVHIAVSVVDNILNRERRYNVLAMSSLVNGGSQAMVRIVWGIIVKSGNGLIIGTVLAGIVQFLYLSFNIRVLKLYFSCGLSRVLSQVGQVARKYRSFPLYDAPALLVNFMAMNLPVILLASFFPMSDVGCYSLIVQLLVLPISFIGMAIGRVYYQQIAEAERTGNAASVGSDTLKVLKLVAVLAALPSLFIACGGDRFIVIFLGGRWTTAGNIALCLAIWSIPTILSEPLKPVFRVMNRQRRLLAIGICYFVSGIGVLSLGCLLHWNLYLILLLYAVACGVVKVVLLNNILKISSVSIRMLPKWQMMLLYAAVVLILCRVFFLFRDVEIFV